MTKHWALQDAKARLSEVVRAAEKEPQHITVRGEPAAVLISEGEYRRLENREARKGKKQKTLLEVLLACPKASDFELPSRRHEPMRKLDL